MMRRKQAKTVMAWLAGGLLVLSMSGCGTLIGRVDESHIGFHDDYYIGTQTNLKMLTFGGTGYDGYASLFCWITIVCPVALVYSLPVDIAVDTVLLPADIYRKQLALSQLPPRREQSVIQAEGTSTPEAPAKR